MRSDTRSITIEAPPERVFELVADPLSLPRWAFGFARAIEPDGDAWRVTLASGATAGLRYAVDAARGVVDFHVEPAPGVEAVAHSRVLPNGTGSEYVFTQFEHGLPAGAFEAQVEALRRELTVLKALAETSCPL